MKQYFGLGLAMLAGAALGAAGVSALHAAAKPPVYLITEIDVSNPEAYGKEFAPMAQATIKKAGGKLVAIGGAGAKTVTPCRGHRAQAHCHSSLGQPRRHQGLVQ